MNTLFLSSSWKVVVQDLSLLKKRKTTDIGTLRAGKPSSMTLNFINDSSKPYGMTSDWGGRTASAGFTLIELLVVVLIIGILAAVAVPQYTKAVEKSRLVEPMTIINSLEKAIPVYLLANPDACINFFGDNESDCPANQTDALDITLPKSMLDSCGSSCFWKNGGMEFGLSAGCNGGSCNIAVGVTSVSDNDVYFSLESIYSSGKWRHICNNYGKEDKCKTVASNWK